MHRAPALVIAAAAFCGTLTAAWQSPLELACAVVVAAGTLVAARRLRYAWLIFVAVAAAVAAWTLYLTPPAVQALGTRTYHAVAHRVRTSDVGQNIVAVTPEGVRLRLRITDVVPSIAAGDSLLFNAELLTVRRSPVPYMTLTTEPDRADRIAAGARLRRADVRVAGHCDAWIYRCDALRRRVADAVYASPLNPAAARTLVAATLGTGDADHRLKEQFRATGLSHLLCVSGFHVGVAAMLISLLLSPLVLFSQSRRRHLLALIIVWCYAAVAGFTPSVVRAGVMITVFYISKMVQRRHEPFNALCLAFAAVLALDPYQLFSAGFQLSFAAVAALLVFTRRIHNMSDHSSLKYRILNLVVPPAAAMAGTLPVMLAWFHRVPLLSVPFNVVGVAVFPIFMICGGVAVLAWYLSPLGKYLCLVVNELYHGIESFLNSGAEVAGRYVVCYAPGTVELMAIIVILVAVAVIINTGRAQYRIGGITAAVAALALTGCGERPDTHNHLIIDGDSRGTDIYVVTADVARTYVTTASGYATTRYYNFFEGLGYDDGRVETVSAGIAFDTPFGSVGLARYNTDYLLLAGCDIVIIAGRLKKPLSDLLATLRPRLIIIGANVPIERRRLSAAACRAANIPYHSVADDGPYYCTASMSR